MSVTDVKPVVLGPSEQCFHDVNLICKGFLVFFFWGGGGLVSQIQTAADADVLLKPVMRVSSGKSPNCHNVLKPM